MVTLWFDLGHLKYGHLMIMIIQVWFKFYIFWTFDTESSFSIASVRKKSAVAMDQEFNID